MEIAQPGFLAQFEAFAGTLHLDTSDQPPEAVAPEILRWILAAAYQGIIVRPRPRSRRAAWEGRFRRRGRSLPLGKCFGLKTDLGHGRPRKKSAMERYLGA